MGLTNFGVPEEETLFLKNELGLSVFVEGGTYQGGTAKAMSEFFSEIFTIEKSQIMFDEAKTNIGNIKNIKMLNGDTRDYLRDILEQNDDILLWLDAHWSGGNTYGQQDECPLLEELRVIFNHNKNYAILIDDARLFLAPPPKPHNHEHWSSLVSIVRMLPQGWELTVHEDVIYIFPNKISKTFKDFLQEKITKKHHSKNKLLKRLIQKAGLC